MGMKFDLIIRAIDMAESSYCQSWQNDSELFQRSEKKAISQSKLSHNCPARQGSPTGYCLARRAAQHEKGGNRYTGCLVYLYLPQEPAGRQSRASQRC